MRRLEQLAPSCTSLIHDSSSSARGGIAYKQLGVGVAVPDNHSPGKTISAMLRMEPVLNTKAKTIAKGLVEVKKKFSDWPSITLPLVTVCDHLRAERLAAENAKLGPLGCHHHKTGNGLAAAEQALSIWSSQQLQDVQRSGTSSKDIVGNEVNILIKQLDPSFGFGCGSIFRSNMLAKMIKGVWPSGLGFARIVGSKWGARSFNSSRLLHFLGILLNMESKKELTPKAAVSTIFLTHKIALIDAAVGFIIYVIYLKSVVVLKHGGEISYKKAEDDFNAFFCGLSEAFSRNPRGFLTNILGKYTTLPRQLPANSPTSSIFFTKPQGCSKDSIPYSVWIIYLQDPATFNDVLLLSINVYMDRVRRFIESYDTSDIPDSSKFAGPATSDTVESCFGTLGMYSQRSTNFNPYRIVQLSVSSANRSFISGISISPDEVKNCRKDANQVNETMVDFSVRANLAFSKAVVEKTLSKLYLPQCINLAKRCNPGPSIDILESRKKKQKLVEFLTPQFDSLRSLIGEMEARNILIRQTKRDAKINNQSS